MQRKLFRILIAASLAFAPLAIAHDDQGGPGTPDFTCQTPTEWQVHDYAAANGRTVADISDNNLEECGTTYGLFIAGTPECRNLEEEGLDDTPVYALLCQTDRPADYDGDLEFALGGALLAVESGDGTTSGSIVCLGTLGHHGSIISVQDQLFGSNVAFTVGADASLVPVPGEPDCGDNVTRPCEPNNSGLGPVVDAVLDLLQTGNCNPNDHRVTCLGWCDVPFGPGAEGTYVVWVHPTAAGGPGGSPTGASHGHVLSEEIRCGDDELSFVGTHPPSGAPGNPPTSAYTAGVDILFTVGSGRVLLSEDVAWSGNAPSPNPNAIAHGDPGPSTQPTGTHPWHIGHANDVLTRTFDYEFVTLCLLPNGGGVEVTSGTVAVYN